MRPTLVAVLLLTATTARSQEPQPPPQLAHFHHVHLNATDPKAAIDFYTSKFDCEKAKFAGARMLVAQSIVEGIMLLTVDPVVARYPAPVRRV